MIKALKNYKKKYVQVFIKKINFELTQKKMLSQYLANKIGIELEEENFIFWV